MNALDDATLIQQFVARQTTLTTSPNLRIESAPNVTQLSTQNGELLARLDCSTQPAIVQVKQGIQHRALLHQILSEHGFVLMQGAQLFRKLPNESEFSCYEAQQIPIGYQMHCTEAKTLWKVWSAQTHPRHRLDSRLELLLFTPTAWLPIQDVSCHWGVVSIKTLIKAASLQKSEYVTWLQKRSIKDELGQCDRQSTVQTPTRSYG